MANIEIDKREFDELLGKSIDEEKMIEQGSMLGAHWHSIDGDVCEVETYPNRPDLLSVEGLARAYQGFFGIETGKKEYEADKGDEKVEVDDSVDEVRPHIAGAIVRDLELSKKKINGLIQLQEKLHETMGRRRDKLAIGLHDLEELEPPFTYRAVEPEAVSFKPLEYDKEMQLGEILDEHEKGRKYSWILEDEERYPIIEDSERKVLSFPPIINNQLTEVHSGTSDIFIDVTGKHEETVKKALNILVTALADRGGQIESLEVGGETMPDHSPEKEELDVEYFREVSGLDLSAKEVAERLEKMRFGADAKKRKVEVEVPAYRTDIMHDYDLIEDVVIAHRYDNIEPEMPKVDQLASQKDIEDLADRVRDILTGKGALEANTYYLSSKEKLFEKMDREPEEIAEMSNALTEDYAVVRNWLSPSLFQALHDNRHHSYPQEFFEAEDVVELDDSAVGASNRTKLAYLISGTGIDYTDARKALQVLERDLGVELEVREAERDFMKDGRCAEILLGGEKIGFIGQYSDKVVTNWDLDEPVAGFEVYLDELE
ncbi:MAG: phenylalanine--tRNA ligase subunit beta [Candidatus Nanosalina sp.]